MVRLLDLQKQFIKSHLKEGDVAVDFTMGNGYDTEFLCRTVGEKGRVYAFDIQKTAVESTEARLGASDCPRCYTLINCSHHRAGEFVEERIKAGMFNLGYLPGGDKSVTTVRATTMSAVKWAVEHLDRDAILSVAVYPGHPEGDAEGKMLEEYFSGLDRFVYSVAQIKIINSASSPYFTIIETK